MVEILPSPVDPQPSLQPGRSLTTGSGSEVRACVWGLDDPAKLRKAAAARPELRSLAPVITDEVYACSCQIISENEQMGKWDEIKLAATSQWN